MVGGWEIKQGKEGGRDGEVVEEEAGLRQREKQRWVKLISVGPSLIRLPRLCYICRWRNQFEHVLDNSTPHTHTYTRPTPSSYPTTFIITHPIALHSPIHKNNNTRNVHIYTLRGSRQPLR